MWILILLLLISLIFEKQREKKQEEVALLEEGVQEEADKLLEDLVEEEEIDRPVAESDFLEAEEVPEEDPEEKIEMEVKEEIEEELIKEETIEKETEEEFFEEESKEEDLEEPSQEEEPRPYEGETRKEPEEERFQLGQMSFTRHKYEEILRSFGSKFSDYELYATYDDMPKEKEAMKIKAESLKSTYLSLKESVGRPLDMELFEYFTKKSSIKLAAHVTLNQRGADFKVLVTRDYMPIIVFLSSLACYYYKEGDNHRYLEIRQALKEFYNANISYKELIAYTHNLVDELKISDNFYNNLMDYLTERNKNIILALDKVTSYNIKVLKDEREREARRFFISEFQDSKTKTGVI